MGKGKYFFGKGASLKGGSQSPKPLTAMALLRSGRLKKVGLKAVENVLQNWSFKVNALPEELKRLELIKAKLEK